MLHDDSDACEEFWERRYEVTKEEAVNKITTRSILPCTNSYRYKAITFSSISYTDASGTASKAQMHHRSRCKDDFMSCVVAVWKQWWAHPTLELYICYTSSILLWKIFAFV